MAVNISVESAGSLGEGNDQYVVGDITWDSSYPTGGESISGLISGGGVKLERVSHFATGGGGYVAKLDKANQKVIVYRQKDPGNAGGADIPLPEVGNTTDLSAQTWSFFAVGQ
jgi:hypothetical protein